MICVACGNEAGYNRAVVDVHRRVEIGGFCVRCEHQHFKNDTIRLGEYGNDECRFCSRSGLWALPLWCPSTYTDGDRVVSYVDYDIESATLFLCDEHLNRITRGTLHESAADGENATETVPE